MVPRESASFDAEAPWRRELNRGAAFGFGRNYSHRNGRSYDLLNDYQTQLQGQILDVGAGDQATFFVRRSATITNPLTSGMATRSLHAMSAMRSVTCTISKAVRCRSTTSRSTV